MTHTPWMKWYPADWRADPKLRACSPVARYVWMEMLGLMHEAEPYGHLLLNGRPVPNDVLARLIGVEVRELSGAVKELDRMGVFSRTDAGVIYSRRMIRDENKAKSARENGKKGGSPSLKNQQLILIRDNPTDKGEDKAHIPEARDQSLLNERLAQFPRDGSIDFGPWADVAREAGRNIDVNILASEFRKFCRGRGIELDSPGILKAFRTFCAKHKVAA